MKSMMTIATSAFLLAVSTQPTFAQARHTHAPEIPRTMVDEHEELQWSLEEAVKAPGRVGAAARKLEAALTPHFRLEERYALPPIGVLRRLVEMEDVELMQGWFIPLTDSLRSALPRMLEEHKAIHAKRSELEQAARDAGNRKVIALAQELARHAEFEEEVLYPAGVLAGEIVRRRSAK